MAFYDPGLPDRDRAAALECGRSARELLRDPHHRQRVHVDGVREELV